MREDRLKILVTGGTGSLGSALVEKWHKEHELIIYSRDLHKQSELRDRTGLSSDCFILGDICDREKIIRTIYDGQFDVLIHAAALKVVSQGEENPDEYIRVNVYGSQIVASAWHWYGQGKTALYVNSDKSVSSINLYGMTKAIGEKVFLSYGFSSIRYGNVVQSKGSFIHKWIKAKRRGDQVELRLPMPTRFFLTIDDAISAIENALKSIDDCGDGIYIPTNLQAFDLMSVAKALDIEYRFGVLQKGEKQHEVLMALDETIDKFGYGGLAKLKHGYDQDRYHYASSETADRISGDELLRKLGMK